MKVEVRVFATLRNAVTVENVDPNEAFILEVEERSRLQDLLDLLGLDTEQAIIGLINGLRQTNDYLLKDGDRVGLFPPVGGG